MGVIINYDLLHQLTAQIKKTHIHKITAEYREMNTKNAYTHTHMHSHTKICILYHISHGTGSIAVMIIEIWIILNQSKHSFFVYASQSLYR